MNFAWSESQLEIQKLARAILSADLNESTLRDIEASESFFHAGLWQRCAQSGLLGVAIREEHGGHGGGISELCAFLYMVGRSVAPIPALACLSFGAFAVDEVGSDRQRARWLPAVVAGTAFLSAAYEEPGMLDPMKPVTRASYVGEQLQVSGEKICVPLADRAARVLMPVNLDGELALVLLDPSAAGVSSMRGMATHGEAWFRLTLERVVVADQDVVSRGEQAHTDLRLLLDAAIASVCAVALGVSERALEMTAEYVRERQQFGVAIGSFQAVRQRAADAYIDVEAMRVSLQQAIFLLDQGRDAQLACAVAKQHACEAGYRVTYAAQHLHGGMGYDTDYPLHRYYLWSKALALTLGSAPQHLQTIGRALAAHTVRIGD
jgi:3-oxocholest-4-en-26-oyl-CoA dehydrogenase beta subunit